MGFIDSIKSFYFKTFDFRTRSSRSEFWYAFLAIFLFSLVILFIPLSYSNFINFLAFLKLSILELGLLDQSIGMYSWLRFYFLY